MQATTTKSSISAGGKEKKKVYLTVKRDGIGAFTERVNPAGFSPEFNILEKFSPAPTGPLAESLTPGPSLSFAYEDFTNKDTMKTMLLESDTMDNSDPAHPTRRIVLSNPNNGLRLDIDYVYHPAHRALIIGGKLSNTSAKPIRNVRNLCSFDLAFDAGVTNDTTVYTMGGGVTHFVFPPFAFQIDKRRVMGSLWASFSIDSGITGRSSDKYMPFFYIADENDSSGVYAGLEWSGIWKINFHRREEYLFVSGGMTGVDLTLRPGEELQIPRTLLGFYEGSIHEGRNALRRFIRDWFPKYQGQDLGAPVTWNHAFTFGPSINHEIFRRQVPVCADLGFEWMQIDWGWFAGCRKHKEAGGEAFSGIGNWLTVDPERFPDGIEPLADLVRSHGMKYCTWVDPEEAHPSSMIAQQHPDWMLYHPERMMGMVNFGLKDVQDWFLDTLTMLIKKWGIYKLKWDHNIDPFPIWELHDDPKHKGLLQLKHVQGVWRVWEELRKRNPELVLENCSSGGRRFDLGTFGRAHIHHGSDFNFHNDIIRTQIHGANTVMPTYRVIHTCTWGGSDFTDNYIQSRFGGILRFSQDFASWPKDSLARVKKHIAVYKTIRHLLKEDFYAVFPQPKELTDWDGWQYHDPKTHEGFLIVFRMRGDEESRTARLRGLKDGNYVLKDPYTGEEVRQDGKTLRDKGISIAVPKDTAKLFHYSLAG
jgi:alpha-galactosidase